VTNKTFSAAYRGAGRPEAAFVFERMLDIGARKLGLTPPRSDGATSSDPRRCPIVPG
jgi:carbon-monoxide dehydrogenase large subunit